MAYCKICGSTLEEFDKVCSNCGTPVTEGTPKEPESKVQNNGSAAYLSDPVVGSWGYVGAILLLGLPVIGLILAIIWAVGGVSNHNLRNLARANLLLLLIWTVILLSILLSILVKFGSIMYFLSYLVNLFV